MPIELEKKLMKEAMRRHLDKKRKGSFVYGTMRKLGWKPTREMKNG